MLSTGKHSTVEVVEPVAVARGIGYPPGKCCILRIGSQCIDTAIGKDHAGLQPYRLVAVKHELDIFLAGFIESPAASCPGHGRCPVFRTEESEQVGMRRPRSLIVV